MATVDDVVNAIRNADAAGDSAAVRQLGAVLQQMQTSIRQTSVDKLRTDNPAEYDPKSQEWQDKYGPTSDMSTASKVLAGAGKAFTDIGRGVGQLLGFKSQADTDESRRLDAPLMATTAGKVGDVAGTVAATLPTVFLPGASTLTGAAKLGAALGAVQPISGDESRLGNTLLGGALGAAGPVVARGAAGAYQGAKALAEPFTAGGRAAIAGRTLQRFGVDAGDVAGLSSTPTTTGARTTLAEQISRPEAAAGAARLQDAMRAADPEIAASMAAREVENNAARVGTLQELAGEGGKRDFYSAARTTTAKQMYDDAFSTGIDASSMSAAQRDEITKLLKMPAIRDAAKAAQEIAQNQGTNVGNQISGSVEGLHNMKLALDDQIANLSNGTVSQVNRARAVEVARDRLVSFIEKVSPQYGEARSTYAAMSKPLNQMDVADTLFRKGTSATSDLGGTPRLMPDRFVNLLKNEEATVKSATGRDLGKLSEVLDPDQFSKVMAVGQELDKSAAVGRAANGPGSATAQRMASQNVLRQLLGPTGLPESWAESTLLNTGMRPIQFAYNGVAEPRIQAVLADVLLNPAKAQAVMQAARTAPQSLPAEVQAALPYIEQALKASVPAAALTGQR